MRLHSNRDRPLHLGPLALERVARGEGARVQAGAMPGDSAPPGRDALAHVLPEYLALYARFLDGRVAGATAPVTGDPVLRAQNLKAAAYFLDAAIAGICEPGPEDRHEGADVNHSHALVFLVEFGREPEPGEPGDTWIRGSNTARTDLRVAEIAVVLSGYLRWLGYAARGHVTGGSQVDLEALAVRAGVARAVEGRLVAPFVRSGFRIGAVTTAYALARDLPLAQNGPLEPDDAAVYFGLGGTRPGWEHEEERSRPAHLGRFPMELIRRVDEPTTLLIREEMKRVPKRGDFFKRAAAGDLGEKAQRERNRFPFKHPLALGMMPLIRSMVPLQGERHGLKPGGVGGDLSDPARNAQAIKALGYFLGADFVGICRAEPWMYYSHDEIEGKPIEAYHEYAVVMLIDQGFETMDGASGDDWISATQSMRAYLRGAEIAGVMAAHCRRMGYSARSHSNAHSELIHVPAIVMAGLGEVSRIGDTILNPFIGPRSKSVLLTTDLPMEIDKPIDFGLQDFCAQCRKCARECPCNAIPFGPKVMFNGYEIWKADVEKCTRYRVTQSKGSACGRCMKMCPWNREDTLEARRLAMLSIEVPSARARIIALDELLENGRRNPVKRWWFDLEVIEGVAVVPPAGTNERDLSPGRDEKLARGQKLAFFPPDLQPAGGTTISQAVPVDRAAGIKAYAAAEAPDAARKRLGLGLTAGDPVQTR
jgi:ferredoxin